MSNAGKVALLSTSAAAIAAGPNLAFTPKLPNTNPDTLGSTLENVLARVLLLEQLVARVPGTVGDLASTALGITTLADDALNDIIGPAPAAAVQAPPPPPPAAKGTGFSSPAA